MQFCFEKEKQKWMDNNKTFVADLHRMVLEMVMFEVKYGVRILYEFDKAERPKVYGRGIAEKISPE